MKAAEKCSPCGTYTAYQRHRRNGEPTDAACREAVATYMSAYREANPVVRGRERRRERIRSEALRRLAREYPARYVEIFDALMALDDLGEAEA